MGWGTPVEGHLGPPTHPWLPRVSIPTSSWEGSAGLQHPPAYNQPGVSRGTKAWVELTTLQDARPPRPHLLHDVGEDANAPDICCRAHWVTLHHLRRCRQGSRAVICTGGPSPSTSSTTTTPSTSSTHSTHRIHSTTAPHHYTFLNPSLMPQHPERAQSPQEHPKCTQTLPLNPETLQKPS